VPTDCNQRNELDQRTLDHEDLSWTADAQLSAEEGFHDFDLRRY
jgi:hypothetical protein